MSKKSHNSGLYRGVGFTCCIIDRESGEGLLCRKVRWCEVLQWDRENWIAMREDDVLNGVGFFYCPRAVI